MGATWTDSLTLTAHVRWWITPRPFLKVRKHQLHARVSCDGRHVSVGCGSLQCVSLQFTLTVYVMLRVRRATMGHETYHVCCSAQDASL
jgi:hypothetical protein